MLELCPGEDTAEAASADDGSGDMVCPDNHYYVLFPTAVLAPSFMAATGHVLYMDEIHRQKSGKWGTLESMD
jgi:hypothetical protein